MNVLAAVTTAMLVVAAPSDNRVCGVKRCFSLSQRDTQVLAAGVLSGGARLLYVAPKSAPFWTVRSSGATGFYVPGAFRINGRWIAGDMTTQRLMARITIDLEPFDNGAPTRATVGGRRAQDPASYERLWSAGARTSAAHHVAWIRVRLYTSGASPWQGTVSVSRRGSLLLRDGNTFKISPRLAARVRARVSLR